MMHARKQVLIQIALVHNVLQQNQQSVAKQKRYFQKHSSIISFLIVGMILAPALWLGWRMRSEQWANKLTVSFMDMTTVIFMNYFKRQLSHLFQS